MAVQLADISFEKSRDTGKLNRELAKLAEWAGSKLLGKVGMWHYDGDPVLQGELQGFPFRLFYLMHRAGQGGVIMFPSISLVLDLPKPTPYRVKMRNKDSVRLNFYAEQIPDDPGPVTDLPEELLDQVVSPELRELFRDPKLDLEYALLIDGQRITLTVFFAYQHEFYIYLLEQMAQMADALSKL